MASVPRPQLGDTPNDITIQAAAGDGGRLTAIVSAIALLFSAYSLWDSSLKAPDLKVFVPPVIQYSSPYNNSNFEVFAIPITAGLKSVLDNVPEYQGFGKLLGD